MVPQPDIAACLADIDDVIELMKHHRIKRVLVCDGERHVVGVVTRSDLIRIFFDRYLQVEKS